MSYKDSFSDEDIEARIKSMQPHIKFVRRLGTFPKGKFVKEVLIKNKLKIVQI